MATMSKSKSWVAREGLREKGQFWTPQWVARPMVRYAVSRQGKIFDPAVGAGAFARALKDLLPDAPLRSRFFGCEIDPEALAQSGENDLQATDLGSVEVKDFLRTESVPSDAGIVANPPYIRHHRMSGEDKARFQELAYLSLRQKIDGRAGIHVFFLIHALALLGEGQKLSFIVPADIAEGVFATPLWTWILGRFRLDAVVRFEHKATPFPGVDTNPLVLFLRNERPGETFVQATCSEAGSADLDEWVSRGLPGIGFPSLSLRSASVQSAATRGVGRDEVSDDDSAVPLSQFATTLRGIATGANEFFFMTRARMLELKLPTSYFVRAVGRTRDVQQETLGKASLDELDEKGTPTFLLSISDRTRESLPRTLNTYLDSGEQEDLHLRSLISQRRPWFRMEVRRPPAFLFAYLGRRNARFIRNESGAVPLTGFLCVYPKYDDEEFTQSLWRVLQDTRTVSQLSKVGKSYGGGAIKVEPRALSRLPIPMEVLKEHGLDRWLDHLSPGLGAQAPLRRR